MNDLPGTIDELKTRLETLEHRVYALEHRTPEASAAAPAPFTIAATEHPDANPVTGQSLPEAGSLFPVLGRAMLGLAGAYLLRAIAESTALPRLAVAAIAILYAVMWLVWAARTKAENWLPAAIYAGTSSLILAPMLWELTLSFKVLSPSATAAILAAYVLIASALAWKRDLAPVLWVANGTASIAALALAIATHQLIPFIAALLLMVLVCEIAVELHHELSLRPFLATAADLAILALVFIYSRPQTGQTDYPPLAPLTLLAPGCLLFLIYAAGLCLRTVMHGKIITAFQTLQAIAAFLLAASSLLSFEPQFGATALGVASLLLALACYALVFFAFRPRDAGPNFQVFAAWATALLFTGSLLCLPPLAIAICLGLAAVASTLLGIRMQRLALQVHGLFLLTAASAASGLLSYSAHALAGTLPAALTPGLCIVAACALACYAISKPAPPGHSTQQLLLLVPAALAASALAAFLVQALLALIALRFPPDVHHIAFIRTLITCALALSIGFAGSRWRRTELTWIAYATLALVAVKLVFEDLRHGHLEFIAASLFLFAITLIAVPRLARISPKLPNPQSHIPHS